MARRRRCSRDNGKQFTARFARGGEVLFDKICRRNGIAHRLTAAALADHDGEDRALPPDAAARAARRRAPVHVAAGGAGRASMTGCATTTRRGRTSRSSCASRSRRPSASSRVPARAARAAAAVAAGRLAAAPGAGEHADRRARDRRRRRPGPSTAGRSSSTASFPPSGNLWAMGRQFWLGPQPRRADRPLLGQRRRHPPHDQRRPGQEPALAPQHRRPRPARRRGRGRGRPAAAAARARGRRGDRGRPGGQQQRPRLARRPPGARRRDPRRPPGDRPHRARRR